MKNKSRLLRRGGRVNTSLLRALASPIEMLESRVLLSITAETAVGPLLTDGTTWNYTTTGPGLGGDTDTAVNKVVGATTFNGNSVIDVHSTDTTTTDDDPPSVTTDDSDVYIGLSDGTGYTVYGSVSGGQTIYYSTPNHYFPAVLDVESPTTSTQTLTGTFTNSDGNSQTNVVQVSITYTLLSDTTQSITVPAGTYDCYQVNESQTTTVISGPVTVGQTSTTTSVDYATPGVGIVEEIDDTGDSQTTEVLTAYATQPALVFTQNPSDSSPGQVIDPPIEVEVHGSDGQLDTNANEQISLAIDPNPASPASAVLGGHVTAQTVGGIATFSDISVSEAGDYELTATGTESETAATSEDFSIGGDHLVFSLEPEDAGINAEIPLAISVEDGDNDLVVNASGTVDLSLTTVSGGKGAVLGGEITGTIVDGIVEFSGTSAPKINVGGKYTLTATEPDDESVTKATSDEFAIALEHLVITKQPANVDAKAPIDFTVEVKDSENKVDTDYTDKVMATLVTLSGGLGATLEGTATMSFVNGIATFAAANAPTIAETGDYELTLTAVDADTSDPVSSTAAVTTKGFKVAGDKLIVLKQPTQVDAESPIPLEIELRDSKNKVDTNNSTDGVELTLNTITGGAGAELSGTPVAQFASGIATFGTDEAVSINIPGTYTLTVSVVTDDSSDEIPAEVTTKQFKVVGFHLVFKTQPANSDVDTSIPFTVEMEDASNKLDTTESSDFAEVSLSNTKNSSDASDNLEGITKLQFADGVADFPASDGLTIDTPGQYTLSATALDDGGVSQLSNVDDAVSTSFKVAGFHLVFKPQPGPSDVDTPLLFSVIVEDSKNKIDTDDTGSEVEVTLNPVKGGDADALAGDTNDVTITNGVAEYNAALDLEIDTPGTYTLTATEMINDPDTGMLTPVTTTSDATSNSFTVKGFHLEFKPQPVSSDLGDPLLFKVEVLNSKNNVDTSDNLDQLDVGLNIIKGDVATELTGTSTVSIISGIGEFTAAQELAPSLPGKFTLTATETSLDSDTGLYTPISTTTTATSNAFTITGYHLDYKTAPTDVDVDDSIPMKVAVEDQKNNVDTGNNDDSVELTLNTISGGKGANLDGPTTGNLSGGFVTFPIDDGVTINAPGKYTITATLMNTDPETEEMTADPTTMPVTSKVFTVSGLHLVFKTQPKNADVDAGIPFTVVLEDSHNQIDTTENTTIVGLDLNVVSANDSAALKGTDTITFVNGQAIFPQTGGISIDTPGKYTLTATEFDPDDGGAPVLTTTDATSSTFTITGDHLVFITQPTDTVVNDDVPFTVVAEDSKNQIDKDDAGDQVQVTLNTISGGTSAVLAGITTINLNAGQAVFPETDGVSINSPGTYTLTATEIGDNGDGTGVGPITTTLEATSKQFKITGLHLVFTTQPITTNVDAPLLFTIEVEDTDNTIDTQDVGSDVLITLNTQTGDTGGELVGTAQMSFVNGIATFTIANGLSISAAGQYTLTATEVTTDDTGAQVEEPATMPAVSKVFSVKALV